MSRRAKIFLSVIAVFIVMQFFRIDKTNPEVVPENDFVMMYNTPDSIKSMIKTSCYDCHSNETVYPAYSNIAPVSWLIKHHVIEGREHLNFSEFGTYNTDQKKHALHEAEEHIENGKMPMKQYTLLHPEATLSETQKEVLINYFKSIASQIDKADSDDTAKDENHSDNEADESHESSENHYH